jgi:glycosyltransferase involved in cell wall biosynthesis
MTAQRHKYIIDFFDLSILIPVDADELDQFRKNLYANQSYLTQNGIEVLLIVTGSSAEVMSLPDEFPFINWRIIIMKGGPVKGVAAQLNAGLPLALHKYVLVMDADTVLVSDSIYQLRFALHHYPQSFALLPRYESGSEIHPAAGWNAVGQLEYRLLMAERSSLQTIGGFGEWGDDRLTNVHIQRKLELAGQYRIILAATAPTGSPTQMAENEGSATLLAAVLFPSHFDTGDGHDKAESAIGFDWTRDKSPRAVSVVLEKFEKVAIKGQQIFQQEYGIIGLMQTRNEAVNIPGVLSHLDGLCDGIIILDDGSDDGSYEIADSPKLLLKVQKSNKGIFDDLGNRNLLLQLAWLFKSEWFFFIDADERFDLRYADLRQVARLKNIDTIAFKLVHLWDLETRYRKDIPEGKKGVFSRNRMFRNKGFLQTTSEREIHFCATPFKHNRFRAAVLLLHFGLLDEAARVRKFNAYLPQDAGGKKQGYSYAFLMDRTIELGNLDDLVV